MLKVLPILAIFVVLLTLILLASPLFQIHEIKLLTDNRCVSQGFVQNSGLKGQNLLTFSPSSLAASIKSKFACVQDVKIQKDFPNNLKVTITSLLPLAKIDGTNLFVSSKNTVVTGADAGLPVIFLPNPIPLKAGDAVTDPQLLFVDSILNQLKDTDYIVSSVRVIDPGNIIVYNRENALAIFSQNLDLSGQINSLQEVIAKSRIDATKIQKIDLRFDKPIIVFK